MVGDGQESARNLIPLPNFQEAEHADSSWTHSPSPQKPPVLHLLLTACSLVLFLHCFYPFIRILLRFRLTVDNLCGWADASPSPSAPAAALGYVTAADREWLQSQACRAGLAASPLPFSMVKTQATQKGFSSDTCTEVTDLGLIFGKAGHLGNFGKIICLL